MPVAGGTFPALIWKAFMTKALAYMKAPPENFASPPYLSASAGQGGQPKRRARARQRRVQERLHDGVLRRRRAGAHRRLQAERSRRSRTWSGESIEAATDATGRAAAHGGRSSTSRRGPATGSGTSSDSSHAAARRRPTTRSRSSWRSRCTVWSRASSGSGFPERSESCRGCISRCAQRDRRAARVVHQSLPAQTASAPGRTIVLTLTGKTAG